MRDMVEETEPADAGGEPRLALPALPRPGSRWQRAFYVPLTILAWTAVAVVALWLLGHVAHTVVMVVLAAVLAFALAPLVSLLRRWISRPLAVALAYLFALAFVVGLGFLLILTAAQQVVSLVQNLPSYTQRIQGMELQLIDALRPVGINPGDVQQINQQLLAAAQQVGGSLTAGSLGFVGGIAGGFVDAVLILMLSVYFTLSGPRVVTFLREATPPGLRTPARFTVRTVNNVVGGYVRGTLTMALLIGALVGIGLGVMGVPYALLLGVLAFFMEFVPVAGVLISGAVSVAASIPNGVGTVVAVLVYFVVVHVIESDIVGPRVMGKAVGIHPAVGIIALLAGSELFGVWGALFASPLAGLLQAAITAVWRGVTEKNPDSADVPGTNPSRSHT